MKLFGGIQMLRGAAALLVMIGHALMIADANKFGFSYTAYWASLIINSGVDLFFVISGFIISNSIAGMPAEDGRIGNAWAFAIRRAVRIFPVYWAALVFSVLTDPIFPVIGGAPKGIRHEVLAHIFLLIPLNYFVPPAWSLCFEVHFYAAAAVLILIDRRLALPAAVAGLVAILWAWQTSRPEILLQPMVAEFCMGVIIEHLIRFGAKRFSIITLALAGIGFAAGVWFNVGQTNPRVVTFGIGSAFLVYAICCIERSGLVFPKWMQYPGTISYSLYIWHWPIFTIFLSSAWRLPPMVQMAATIGAVTLAAILSYRFIEVPTILASKTVFQWKPARIVTGFGICR